MRNWVDAIRGRSLKALILDLGYTPGYREMAPIVLYGEARDTHKALTSIPAHYGQAVAQYWQFEDEPIRWHSRRRQVHPSTFTSWVVQGHDLLKQEIYRAADDRARRAASWSSSWLSRN